MQRMAKGTFEIQARSRESVEVRVATREADSESPGMTLGKIRFDKQFSGEMQGISVVEMMSAGNPSSGSAGYVALEYVVATLDGRHGSFMLQHSGQMARGVPTLSLTVVPDSGTGGLRGLSGSMSIDIVEKQHYYSMSFAFEAASGET
ncbi:MAG: DUF3224 domain-containing protein [Myxococcales bacterium]